MVGTDRYRLVAISPAKFAGKNFPDIGKTVLDKHQPRIVPAQQFEKVLSEIPSNKVGAIEYAAVTTDEDDKFGLTTTDLDMIKETLIKPVHEKYPNYEGILPASKGQEPAVEFYINPRHLMELIKAVCDFIDETAKNPKNVKISVFDSQKPIQITAKNNNTDQDMIGLLALVEAR